MGRILLVEDDDATREALQDLLEEHGHDVTGCANGSAALDELRRDDAFELVLLDLMMPVMDGWQFRVEQRRDARLSPIPVIAMSADASAKAMAMDVDAYLRKPVETSRVLDAVDRLLAERRRQALESALVRSHESFHELVERAPLGILVMAPSGDLVYANPTLLAYLGSTLPEVRGRRVTELVHPDDRARFEPGPVRDLRLLRASGTDITVEGLLFPMRFDEHNAVVAMLRDVTTDRELRARLALSDRLVSVGTLAAGVAHEVNNPLAYVIANLDFAAQSLGELDRDPALLAEVREALEEARTGARRVQQIVRDLKTFSRPDEERRTRLDVRQVLESACNMAWNEIRHRARLTKRLGEVPPVYANEARLGQVFLNLLVNAAQAIPEGAADRNQIRLETSTDPAGRAVVEIADTGCGISAQSMRRLFEPFYTTKPIGIGTGLGLAIAHRIVSEAGGTIEVDSEVGRGSRFRVRLPAAAREKPEPARPEIARGPRRRILVIDDDAMVGKGLARSLAAHDVTLMTSATDALARLRAGERFDVILCDLMMPVMTGMEFHAAVPPELGSRIVFLTGGAFTDAAREFLDRVPNDRLEKPFDLDALQHMIDRVASKE